MAYSIKAAAALLGLHPKTLRRWEDKKKFIPNRTLGNQRRFSEKDIAALRAIKEGRAEPVIYDRILTTDLAAQKLKVSPDTIRRWTKQGKIAQTVNDQLETGYSEKALDKLLKPKGKTVPVIPTPPQPSLTPSRVPQLETTIPWLKKPKLQKAFVYGSLAGLALSMALLAYLLILRPPFLADPSVEQLDLTQDIEVVLPRTASFLDGHITIGTDTGDYSFLDQNANLYVKNEALIEGGITTTWLQFIPSEQPENQIGKLYVNQDTGDLMYFDGLEWIAIGGSGSNGNPTFQDVYDSGDTTVAADNQDFDITLGNNATASATSFKLTLAGVSSAFQILGGAGQEIITVNDDALYPVTISQPTQVLANLYARQFIDSDNLNYYLDPANSSVSLAVAGDATIASTLTFRTNGEYLTNSINDYLVSSGGLGVGGSTSYGIGPTGHGNFKKGNFEETLTAGALFDANGQIDLGDGGDAITLDGSSITFSDFSSCTLTTNSSGVLTCGSSSSDAETLDGLDSTQFLRSDTSDSFTSGTLTLNSGTTLDINGDLSIADTNISFDGATTTFTQTTGGLFLDAGGTTAVTIKDNLTVDGAATISGTTTFNTVTYTWPGSDAAASGYALTSNGAGTLSWSDFSSFATNYWRLGSGALSPVNDTLDLLIGGSASTSADFAFLNVNSGTPTASFSGNLVLNSEGVIQTTQNQSLTIGGATTGDLTLAENTAISGNLTLTGTFDANGQLDLGDGGDSITLDGSSLTLQTTGAGSDITFNAVDQIILTDFVSCTSLETDGSGVLTCGSDDGGASTAFWRLISGALSPINDTLDLLIGGSSSESAKFAFINVNSGTPTASIAGNLVLNSAGVIQTTQNQTLTIGGNTTGNLNLAEDTAVSGSLTLSGLSAGTDNTVLVLNSSNQVVTDEIDSRVWGTSLIDGSGSSGYLPYFSDADSLTSSLLYQSSGKVGLGTTSLLGLLNVNGDGGGNALAIFNETAGQDIIAASASGVTRFRVDTNGYVIAQRFSDLADTTYFVDPAASGTSLNIEGNIVSNGAFSISSNGNNNITIDAGTGTVLIGSAGTGKLDAGTVDPPFTINGDKYATYLSGMTGVKEETTGVVATNEYISGIGYRYTIDFTNLPQASDLWLFTKVTDLKKHLPELVVLLSPAGNNRAWYTLDTVNYQLHIYSSRPTTVSYRLTAPRFDAQNWANTRDSSSTGFIINDEGEWQENLAGTVIGETENFWDEMLNQMVTYLADLSLSLKSLTVEEKIISPVVQTQNLATNFISPIIEAKPIVIDADVSVSGTLTADRIESSTITNLRDKIADLAEYYREQTATAAATPSDPVTDKLTAQLLAPSASDSAYMTVENLEAKAGFFSEYLAVIGQATLTDVKINNLLTVNSVTSANGAINFLAGLMTLDSTGKIYINGDVNITGNLAVTGNLTASDTLIASQIAPPQDTDLSIKIASQSALSIYNLIGEEAVASINASGSGSFSSLSLKASGTATISAGLNSVAVTTEQLNPNSQVIVTFTSNYAPATKYWVAKEPELKLFNVFVNYPVNEETTLDWLLIN